MHVLAAAGALVSGISAVFVCIDIVMFMLRLHGPFTATGETLLFLLTLGRRKPRFFGHLAANPMTVGMEAYGSILKCASLGAVFWVASAIAAWYAYGPIKPIHEW